MKKLTLKPLPEGGHGVFNEHGNDQLGYLDHKELMDYLSDYQKSLGHLAAASLSENALPIDREVAKRTAAVMQETGLSQSGALRQALRSDPRLAEKYRSAHTGRSGAD